MRKLTGWKVNLWMLAVLLLMVGPVLAQDETTSGAADASAPGLGSLMLVIGVVAILFVGIVIYIRERSGTITDKGDF